MLASSGSAGPQPAEAGATSAKRLEEKHVERAMRETADPLPVGPGQWQGEGQGGSGEENYALAPILSRPIMCPGSVHMFSWHGQGGIRADPEPRVELDKNGVCA